MNGVTSSAMRAGGVTYKVNFGVELPRLRTLSSELPHTYALAAALWKEDIRECRLLAALLMPVEEFDVALAEVWIEQMRFAEEAECTVAHLFARLPDASTAAFAWIAREERMFRLCGWLLLGALLRGGAAPAPRDAAELLDHLRAELLGSDHTLRAAAQRTLMHYMNLGAEQEQQGEALIAGLQ